MSVRPLRRLALVLVLILGAALLPAPPAHAGRLVLMPDGFARELLEPGVRKARKASEASEALARALRRLFSYSGGGMDPNGGP